MRCFQVPISNSPSPHPALSHLHNAAGAGAGPVGGYSHLGRCMCVGMYGCRYTYVCGEGGRRAGSGVVSGGNAPRCLPVPRRDLRSSDRSAVPVRAAPGRSAGPPGHGAGPAPVAGEDTTRRPEETDRTAAGQRTSGQHWMGQGRSGQVTKITVLIIK